jgi:hypothetical protein
MLALQVRAGRRRHPLLMDGKIVGAIGLPVAPAIRTASAQAERTR